MPKAKPQQNTKLGHVGTFRVQGRDGQVQEFKAKTIGILKQNPGSVSAPADAAPSTPGK